VTGAKTLGQLGRGAVDQQGKLTDRLTEQAVADVTVKI